MVLLIKGNEYGQDLGTLMTQLRQQEKVEHFLAHTFRHGLKEIRERGDMYTHVICAARPSGQAGEGSVDTQTVIRGLMHALLQAPELKLAIVSNKFSQTDLVLIGAAGFDFFRHDELDEIAAFCREETGV